MFFFASIEHSPFGLLRQPGLLHLLGSGIAHPYARERYMYIECRAWWTACVFFVTAAPLSLGGGLIHTEPHLLWSRKEGANRGGVAGNSVQVARKKISVV